MILETTPAVNGDPRAWLEHFPDARRSTIANWFHYAVRGGSRTPAAIVHQVQHTVQRRQQRVSDPAEKTYLHAVLEALQTEQSGALAYTQSVLDWEALPRAEREHQKQERGRHFQQQYMAQLPVTPQQQAFLQSLGHTGEPPANRLEASRLIDRLLTARRGGRP